MEGVIRVGNPIITSKVELNKSMASTTTNSIV